jgi:hypothetical protein
VAVTATPTTTLIIMTNPQTVASVIRAVAAASVVDVIAAVEALAQMIAKQRRAQTQS